MLTLDVSRREFLRLGALGIGGLTLADVLRTEAAAGVRSTNKAVINIHLTGGPSHQDLFDLKPQAPLEFRGEFNPVHTNVPGMDICEHFPLLSGMADKFAVVRSLVGMQDDHSSFQTQTGFYRSDLRNVGGRPSLGSVVSKLQGSTESGAPAAVAYHEGEPGFLGPAYRPFRPQGDLRLTGDMTAERLASRANLLGQIDGLRRDVDASRQMEALDTFTQRAVGVVTSGKVADAINLNREDPKVLERYGSDGNTFLLSRRLVEAGVRVVTFNWGEWDTHFDNFSFLKRQLAKLDRLLSALVGDIYERGLGNDVTVVMWGEFGRTPRINPRAGRDHWPRLSCCFLSGGGMQTGQMVGTSNRNAEDAQDRPVHLQEVFATLYHNLGIDAAATTLRDPAGRPQYLVEGRKPIRELVS